MLLHVANISLLAQNTPYFIRFSTTEGLPSNNLGPMANDPDGFLWVGTRNGLARFDGQRFVPFSQLQPLSQLPADNVLALVADTKGYLWVKFAKQLFRLSYATLKVEAMKENAMPQCQDDKGRQYFIDKGTLAVFRENERDFQQIPLQWEGKTVEIQMVCAGKNGLLFLLTDMGVFRFDPQKKHFAPFAGNWLIKRYIGYGH